MYNTYELSSTYSGQKSFYNKAKVVEDGNRTVLISYTTEVCTVEENKVSIPDMYSVTTRRHIREFIMQMFNEKAWDTIKKDYKNGVKNWEF